MRIAVIGAGFCGMASAWHLSQHSYTEVVIFDPKGIAQGTSSIAAGLLHPYVGAHAKLNWRGLEGMQATSQLLDAAENALETPVCSRKGMLRLATNQQQAADFSNCAKKYEDVHWRTSRECQSAVPLLSDYPGIFVNSAIAVDSASYLKGLWLDCSRRNVTLQQTAVTSLAQLHDYDCIIVTMGAATNILPELAHLQIRSTKGQVLEFAWPKDLPPLPFPLNSHAYLLMHPNNQTCIAGATFEKQFSDLEPDVEKAKADILPKVREFFPLIDTLDLINCRAGVRAGTPDRKPLLSQISDKCWVLAGMGARGLLYHALFAKELAGLILRNKGEVSPPP